MRVLIVSVVPPYNDGGGRILLYRHFVLHKNITTYVCSNADLLDKAAIQTPLRLPYPLHRLQKSRFGPKLKKLLIEFENFLWPSVGHYALRRVVKKFKPDLVFTVADTSVCEIAQKTAYHFRLPLVGFFMDWVPLMDNHFGFKVTQKILSERFRRFYYRCDLAFCISEGMRNELGPHGNAKILYPIASKNSISNVLKTSKVGRFRLVYVGSALGFYGRMLQSLALEIEKQRNLELMLIGPTFDWPRELKERLEKNGICLGPKKPEEAEKYLQQADALLVVMSFEKDYELFMKTSFNTKISDYSTFGKPIVFWGPEYSAPAKLLKKESAAIVVNSPDPESIANAVWQLAKNPALQNQLVSASANLFEKYFHPDSLQTMFENEMEELCFKYKKELCKKK